MLIVFIIPFTIISFLIMKTLKSSIILSRNFPVLTNFHSSSFRSRNISENKLNLLTYDMDFSSDINYNLGNGNNSYNNYWSDR